MQQQQKGRVCSVEGVVDSDEEPQVNLRSGESNEQSGCEYGVSDFTENYDDNFDESHSLLGDFFVARPDIDDVYEMHFEEDESDVFDSQKESQSQQQLEVDTTTVQLFPQCPLSLDASVLLIKKFQMRHQLTQVALQLMKLHFPTPNICPSSLYLFNKKLPALKDPSQHIYFCSTCLQQLPNQDVRICPNVECGNPLTERGAVSSFIEVPLEPQLLTLLQSMLLQLINQFACMQRLLLYLIHRKWYHQYNN